MPTDFAFRLSTYLSLGFACLCLGYAEWDLVPEAVVFTVGVIVSLVVSFRLEGRFALTIPQANRMGAVIAVLVVGWLTYRYFHAPTGLKDIHWPTGLLPYLGPLLMVLMPAKLFRPKHTGDWWAMQAVGAAVVGLACAVADDGVFAVLLAAYLVAAVWSAALFCRLRWAGAVAPVPGYPVRPAPVVVSGAGGSDRVAAVAGWLALAAAVALPLFFLTPRSPAVRWQVRAGAETGYTGETTVDLTTTGVVRVNRSAAFEVTAVRADGSPFDDLDPGTRWRGEAFAEYDKGKWAKPTRDLDLFWRPGGPPRYGRLPEPGPSGYSLTFRPATGQTAPVLAEPVVWEPGQPIPVATFLGGGRIISWSQYADGSLGLPLDRVPDPQAADKPPLEPYRQVTRVGPEPDLGPGFALVADDGPDAAAARLRALPVEGGRGVREWADRFLAGLVRAGTLPADATAPAPPPRSGTWVRPEFYEAAARLFRDHFAESGEFRYGLDLRREDTALDPVEDFLLHVKAGHCQRFASALALSLRAVGVPCSLVIGFKGCDPEGGGRYTIRQEHAHAWVAVLVPRDGGRWHWLSVDPTPPEEPTNSTADETWLGAARSAGEAAYSDYIVGYDPDRRKEVLTAGRQHFADNGWNYVGGLAGAFGLAVGVAGLRWQLRRPAKVVPATGTGVGWYGAVVAALAAAGHPVRPGQTPGEHAAEAAAALRADPRTAAVADIPTEAVAALYELRYAGRPLTPERQTALVAAAARLAAEIPRA